MARDDDWEKKEGWTRREWVKAGLAVGGASAATAIGVTLGVPLLSGPQPTEPFPDVIRYTRFNTDQWWNNLEDQPMKVTDFGEWKGATGVFHGAFVDGKHLAGTGLPVLVIRIKRDDSVFSAPAAGDVNLPPGFGLYFDDSARDVRIVAFYDRCVHLCCYPGWQVVTDPPPLRDYELYSPIPPPTWAKYGLDPIYCVCHGSQYEPMILQKSVNDRNGVEYVGALRVYGPAVRAIPVVPIKAVDDVITGVISDPRWYEYC